MNPLLDFTGLPRFVDIKPEHISPAIETLLQQCRSIANQARTSVTATWDSFIQPLTDANERLSRAWGQVSHLNSVMNSQALREVYNANLPKVTQYFAELSQDQALFENLSNYGVAQNLTTSIMLERKLLRINYVILDWVAQNSLLITKTLSFDSRRIICFICKV